MARVDAGGDRDGMTLGQFSGQGVAADRINLSTLHSAKGREFQVVVLFGMDAGRIPWNNPTPKQLWESQRLFYVGFTRAKSEDSHDVLGRPAIAFCYRSAKTSYRALTVSTGDSGGRGVPGSSPIGFGRW